MALQPSSNMCTADGNELDASSNCCGPDEPPDRSHSANCNRTTSASRNPAVISSSQQLQMKKSSFQITCVVPKPDGDSMDDLDDVTNTEDVSSEMHAAGATQPDQWSSAETVSPCETSPRSPSRRRASVESSSQAPDPQSRFRIVKVESRAPSRVRGRWTCMDFSDPPLVTETSSSEGTSTGENPGAAAPPIYFVDNASALQVPFTPAFVYSGGHLVLERAPLNSLADNNIYDNPAAEKHPGIFNGGHGLSGLERLEPVASLSDLADAVGRPGDFAALANAALLPSDSADNADSTFAIDNKIEQAMDLVKSHLMFAVHEEVELLKEQIKDLMMKNAHLEYENNLLKANATPETLAQLEANPAPISTSGAAGGSGNATFSANSAGPSAPS